MWTNCEVFRAGRFTLQPNSALKFSTTLPGLFLDLYDAVGSFHSSYVNNSKLDLVDLLFRRVRSKWIAYSFRFLKMFYNSYQLIASLAFFNPSLFLSIHLFFSSPYLSPIPSLPPPSLSLSLAPFLPPASRHWLVAAGRSLLPSSGLTLPCRSRESQTSPETNKTGGGRKEKITKSKWVREREERNGESQSEAGGLSTKSEQWRVRLHTPCSVWRVFCVRVNEGCTTGGWRFYSA